MLSVKSSQSSKSSTTTNQTIKKDSKTTTKAHSSINMTISAELKMMRVIGGTLYVLSRTSGEGYKDFVNENQNFSDHEKALLLSKVTEVITQQSITLSEIQVFF